MKAKTRAGREGSIPRRGANYPGAPKNFDPENPYADGVAMIAQREHVVREKMVKVETSKVRLR